MTTPNLVLVLTKFKILYLVFEINSEHFFRGVTVRLTWLNLSLAVEGVSEFGLEVVEAAEFVSLEVSGDCVEVTGCCS